MNKKQKLVAKKHRKNKERIKSLKQASVVIASKKSRELVTNSLFFFEEITLEVCFNNFIRSLFFRCFFATNFCFLFILFPYNFIKLCGNAWESNPTPALSTGQRC